jgi:riboflavin biosynthesis pyrimidine reductase
LNKCLSNQLKAFAKKIREGVSMAQLFMMDFPVEKVRISSCFKQDELLQRIKDESPEVKIPPKILSVYGDLYFPPAPEDRPYTFCSVVLSSDGKMAFTDHPAGPIIAKNNYLDPGGALADFWMLNALRTYSDGIVIGAKTLQTEANATSHIFDKELAKERVEVLGKTPHPWNIIVSFDATDIPFEHIIFNVDPKENLNIAIATSPQGAKYVRENFKKEHVILGPYVSREEVEKDLANLQKTMQTNLDKVPVFVTGENNNPDAMLLLYLLRRLKFTRLLIESPSYNWHLMQNKALDEFFINYSMVYAGGTITPGYQMPFSHVDHPHAKLLTIGTHQASFIFTRQKLYYDLTSSVDLSKYKY